MSELTRFRIDISKFGIFAVATGFFDIPNLLKDIGAFVSLAHPHIYQELCNQIWDAKIDFDALSIKDPKSSILS